MNIRIDSREHAALFTASTCPFCGRQLPENGSCKCGVWKRRKIETPTYLIELTDNGPKLAQDSNYWSEQYKLAKEGN